MAVPSRFAGMFNAAAFAYGCGQGAPNPLIADICPTATGAGTVTLVAGYVTLDDGTQVFPLATTAGVTIGTGSNAETVTPSAVTDILQGYDQTNFTATFSNLHGKGDPISSATFGLQEAINYANARGGGVVIVDYRWAQLGGTSAILATAVASLPATVVINDNRTGAGGGALYYAAGSLTNTQTKALNSSPTTIIPAAGANTLITLDTLLLENVFLTGAFANGGVIQASYDTGTTIPASATVAATFLTSPVANQVILLAGALGTNLASAVVNKKIILACATADFITGAGHINWRAAYRVHTGLA